MTCLICLGCSQRTFKVRWTKEKAPENFTARFETSKGNFDIAIERQLSPNAVDRFYQLLSHNFFDNSLFYRVNPGFVAQFGSNDSLAYKKWNSIKVPDEKVVQGNEIGTLSFARGGKESRTSDLFINLGDNSRLDTLLYNEVKGFPAFGKVTKGMENIKKLYSGYADNTMKHFDLMLNNRGEFIERYPKLDTIHKVSIVID